MRTNLEKWNHYREIIRVKDQKFVEANITIKPKILYDVYQRSGEIKELKVTEIRYSRYVHYNGKKPTKIEVTEIKELSESDLIHDIKNIHIGLESNSDKYKSTSATKYVEMNKHYLSLEDAENIASVIKIKIGRDRIKLENGHIRCTYCQKIVPESESVKYEIIFQNSKPDFFSKSGYKRFVDRKTNIYCSNQCGVHDQMAHEG